MNLILGLGNPGEKYASTRHNIGFMVVEKLVKSLVTGDTVWEMNKALGAEIFKKGDLLFAKPQKFMNASGVVVKDLVNFYKVPIDHIWVIHDDIDLPLGKIRIKVGGGSAGHHGINSMIQQLGEDTFVRFRLGVGRGKSDQKSHPDLPSKHQTVQKMVVSNFHTDEEGDLRKLIKHTVAAIETALHKGLDKAMNEYN